MGNPLPAQPLSDCIEQPGPDKSEWTEIDDECRGDRGGPAQPSATIEG